MRPWQRLDCGSAVCFELDSLPPIPRDLGRRRLARRPRARGRRRQPLRRLRGAPGRAVRAASWSCPTCAASTASTRSWRCASPSAAIAAVAIDYFGRTAGVGKRGDDFAYMAARAADDARGDPGRRRRGGRAPALAAASCSVFTVGFCFGGRQSWLAAAGGHGLAGAIGFYGHPGERDGAPGPDAARGARSRRRSSRCRPAPTRTSPPRTTRRSTRRSTTAGVEHELVTTTARRTASSTASRRSSPTPRRTPGAACSRSSSATLVDPGGAAR